MNSPPAPRAPRPRAPRPRAPRPRAPRPRAPAPPRPRAPAPPRPRAPASRATLPPCPPLASSSARRPSSPSWRAAPTSRSAAPRPARYRLTSSRPSTSARPLVVEAHLAGLTARVYRLRANGRDWSLKLARRPALVQNADGQTSFLNELQRRADLARAPGRAGRWRAVRLRRRHGLREPPPGPAPLPVDRRRAGGRLGRAAAPPPLRRALPRSGWPASSSGTSARATSSTTGARIRLFDFGYMYPYDPLVEPNPNGWDAPVFHPAERFETRNLFGPAPRAGARRAARRRPWRSSGWRRRWRWRPTAGSARRCARRRGLAAAPRPGSRPSRRAGRRRSPATSRPLYLAEGWRSHRLDVQDDLHGRTCTPRTLARLAWLRAAAADAPRASWRGKGRSSGATPAAPGRRSCAALDEDEARARAWQVDGAAAASVRVHHRALTGTGRRGPS